jgi:hypothetical protein
MANNKGKTLALILLVVILAWAALKLTPFYFAPFGVLSNISQTIKHSIRGSLARADHFIFPFPLIPVFSLVLLVIWILVIAWVYRDAERRGMNGLLWALLVFIGNLIGLIIYLIIRTESRSRIQREDAPVCPGCQKPVQDNFAFCPGCGRVLKPQCPKCQTEIREEWKVCPRCGAKIGK